MRLVPQAPSSEDWEIILSDLTPSKGGAIDVVIPVYKGYDETLRCIYSVIGTQRENPAYRIVVINDRSPDERLVDQLIRLERAGAIELINNESNLGFVGSANIGMSLRRDHDVIMLNSDTEVFNDWVRRLQVAAYSAPNVASVTPLSNNAEICSYPRFTKEFAKAFEVSDAAIDGMAADVNSGRTVSVPTGVGFCMYMRRSAIDQVGLFDMENFGRGYGEENDWCCRALADGLDHLLACDVFVRHYGATSFGAEKIARIDAAMQTLNVLHPDYQHAVARFIRLDPVQAYRRNIDCARLKAAKRKKRTWLMVNHCRGGGTERHLRELTAQLISSGDLVVTCRPLPSDRNWITFECPQLADCALLDPLVFERSSEQFLDFLLRAGIDAIHVHHLIDFPHSMSDLVLASSRASGISLFVTIHDYYMACPRVTMVNGVGLYCGEPELADCERCILRWGSEVGRPSVWEWRLRFARLLNGASQVFVPSEDTGKRMARYFPTARFVVRPHADMASTFERRSASPRQTGSERHVVVIGAISEQKGSALLESTARYALTESLPLRFTIMGVTDRPLSFAGLPNVTVTGSYSDDEAVERAHAIGADIAWFPAVWPETYSYTLSIAFAAGLFPVAFDLGAIAERIRTARFGLLMPFQSAYDVPRVARSLVALPMRALQDASRSKLPQVAYERLVDDYYHLEPTRD